MAEHRVAVAYSGGRDSTALLHATLVQAALHGVRVYALHVHHGLSSQADAWLAHCEAQCRRWQRSARPVTFVAQRVSGSPARGESVEAWARTQRYAALGSMARAHDASLVLLAHHRSDQAETFLLQALRGAGLAGLSGMPGVAHRDGLTWQRPWLDMPGAAIAAYVRRHRLKHIEDDTNTDPAFARNRLRLQVWPALQHAFEHAEASLAASSRWAQEAALALDELAAIDMAQVARNEGLVVRDWLALSPPRRSNALRAWLKACSGVPAPGSLVTRLLAELPGARSARWPFQAAQLRLHRGVLALAVDAPKVDSAKGIAQESAASIARAGRVALPGWGGELRVARVREGGVPFAWLAHVELRPRVGGEQFQSAIGRPPRSLKKQFQEAGVAMWQRTGPLVYSGGQLVFVTGLGLDARVIGLPGQALAMLRWVANAA